jgi:hypothetical protein
MAPVAPARRKSEDALMNTMRGEDPIDTGAITIPTLGQSPAAAVVMGVSGCGTGRERDGRAGRPPAAAIVTALSSHQANIAPGNLTISSKANQDRRMASFGFTGETDRAVNATRAACKE